MELFRKKFSPLPLPLYKTGSDCCECCFSKIGGNGAVAINRRNWTINDALEMASDITKLCFVENDAECPLKFRRANADLETDLADHEDDPEAEDADLTAYPSDEEMLQACEDGLKLAQQWADEADMKPTGSELPLWWREPWHDGKKLSEKMRDADEADNICERRREDVVDGAARVEEIDESSQEEAAVTERSPPTQMPSAPRMTAPRAAPTRRSTRIAAAVAARQALDETGTDEEESESVNNDVDETCSRSIQLRGDVQRLLDVADEEIESLSVDVLLTAPPGTASSASSPKKVSCHVRLPTGGLIHKQSPCRNQVSISIFRDLILFF